MNRPYNEEQLHQVATALANGEMPSGWTEVESSNSAKVAYHEEWQVYYKAFLSRGLLEIPKAWLRGSRADRAIKSEQHLAHLGFAAPETLCSGYVDRNQQYIFTALAPGLSVTEWLYLPKKHCKEALNTHRQLLGALGTHIGRLHATGFTHGDLRTGNVLAENTGDGFHFTLLDNERTQHRVPPPGRAMLRNLMQLNMLPLSALSKTDRMRFFVNWRREMHHLSEIEAKIIAAEAFLWANRRLEKKPLRASTVTAKNSQQNTTPDADPVAHNAQDA